MGWGSAYIPDLTERFPEGFGGVDLTDSYYPSAGHLPDPWSYLDEEYGEYTSSCRRFDDDSEV